MGGTWPICHQSRVAPRTIRKGHAGEFQVPFKIPCIKDFVKCRRNIVKTTSMPISPSMRKG